MLKISGKNLKTKSKDKLSNESEIFNIFDKQKANFFHTHTHIYIYVCIYVYIYIYTHTKNS